VLGHQLVADPDVFQRDATLGALHEAQAPAMLLAQPAEELDRVAHGGRQQHQANVLGQQHQRELPDDAALQVVEVVESSITTLLTSPRVGSSASR